MGQTALSKGEAFRGMKGCMGKKHPWRQKWGDKKETKRKRWGEEERTSRNFYSFPLSSTELVCHRTPDLIYQNSLSWEEREDFTSAIKI